MQIVKDSQSRMRMKRAPGSLLLVLMLHSTLSLAAGDVYKIRGADGRMRYTDVPPAHNPEAQRLPPVPETAGVVLVPAKQIEETRQRIADRIRREEKQYDTLKSAETKLRQAQQAKTAGEEPLPGERQRLARGGSRLNETYQQRQEQLDQELNGAQREVDAARSSLRSGD